jgi:hypothetical protein
MKTMKKKVSSKKSLMKADKGRIVKSVLKDPEDNTIKTKTNTNTGRTVTRTTFNDPGSSGITKEKRVEKIKRKDRKINEMYANNPKAAAEDDFTPIAPTVKIKIKKAMYGTSMKPIVKANNGIETGKTSGDTIRKSDYNTLKEYENAIAKKRKEGKTVYLPKEKSSFKPKAKIGGAAKPKAMYGTSMKPGMMKKGGLVKKKK